MTTRRTVIGLGGAALASLLTRSARGESVPATPSVGLTGRVIWPQDPAYDEARLAFNTRFSRFPAAIVVCSSVADVQNAVRWARQQGIPLRARSGGHSYEAFCVLDDGLVIDLGGFQEITVDTARGEAVVGAGVRLGHFYRRLGEDGVTVPSGTCQGVGIAGLTLGGGIGFLSRQYGLTCDNLLAVDMVDANGDIVRASEQDHPDLFWALRGGGGGNFGIATSFTFRVHPVAEVSLCSISWPWEDVAEVIDAWQQWAPVTDERLTTGLGVPNPAGGTITSTGQFSGSPAELQSLIAPLMQAGRPSPPQVWSVPFLSAVEQFAGSDIAHSRFKNSSGLVSEPLSAAAIATFVDQMRASPTASNLVGFFPLGGAVAAVDSTVTAFPHRRALFDMQYQAYWQDDADAQADIAWIRAIREAMFPYTNGAYVNYIDAEIADWATAYYGPNLARLSKVKATYDQDDVFNGPQSIPI
jgi:FAD/FMN-containing dehydrogenase